MDTTVVMTTYNRPNLLAQSLPMVERETKRIGAKLLIADDISNDERTIDLLKGAMSRGAEVIHRANQRTIPEDPHERNIASHYSIGYNNIFAFNHVVENYKTKYILKIDDDTYLADGAFERMLYVQEIAKEDGLDVICTSGIRTVNEPVIAETRDYCVTFAACNVGIIFRTEDWRILLGNYKVPAIAADGFDIFFMRTFKSRFYPNSSFICTNPSVIYHTGFTGVHVFGENLNVNFSQDDGGIYSE
jgi:glycosyltransferase involved in cell wall biosynthesis